MSRIVLAECKQEVASFNPVPSHYSDFLVCFGQELIDFHRNARDEIGGALSEFDTVDDVQLVPTYGARDITSGGTLAANDFERLSGEFLETLRRAGQVDAAYFSMHGAMSAENEDDPEGYLLTEARTILGRDTPIVVSLDLHGVLTGRMLQQGDAFVVLHTYPHIDFYEMGARAAKLLLKIVTDGVKPVTAHVKIPALVRGDELITATGSFGHCIRKAQQIERNPKVLSAGMLISNPFTDVPDLRSNSIVVTDNDAEFAAGLAIELAELFWQHHAKMQVPLTSVEESVRIASEVEGTVVLKDAADATSSGATGDSNAILRQLLDFGFKGSALIPIVDPPAVASAFTAGVGGKVHTTVGGQLDPHRFQPLEINAYVRLISDGHFRSESFGQPWYSGDTAVLQSANIILVVASRPVSLFDRSFFYAHGQDPKRFDLVVVKSPHCEPHMYADWCSRIIDVDTPGATSANVRSLGHRKCPRPIFPLDENVAFTPRVEIFQRKH